ncbi:MAG: acetyltransferase [Anaerotruncus massiliensis (ex Togo et al. 2019)]
MHRSAVKLRPRRLHRDRARCALEETRLGDYSYCFAQRHIYSTSGSSARSRQRRLNRAHPLAAPAQHPSAAEIRLRPGDDSVVAWRQELGGHGNDVWLGHNAVIMGRDDRRWVVVGAGAVVTHDVEPYDVAGVPARHLQRRFDGETAAALGRIRWWDWPHELLRERIADFRTIEGFCEKYDPLRAGSK